MENQTQKQKTLGQAIDELIGALSSIDEGSRVTAIKAACDHLKLDLFRSAPPPPAERVPAPSIPGETTVISRVVDIKSLRAEKQPTSANEMAALIAYYLAELVPDSERKHEVETEDMVRFFKQAGFPLPKAPQMLLTNAKNSGYFDRGNAGGYRLNPVGHNLVVHNLPRTNSGAAPAKRRKPRAAAAQKPKKRGA